MALTLKDLAKIDRTRPDLAKKMNQGISVTDLEKQYRKKKPDGNKPKNKGK